MEISFEDPALAKLCSSEKALRRALGDKQAKKVMLRLKQLESASTLDDLRAAPGRCHELTADRPGQLSIDLVQPTRLLFRPRDSPPPRGRGNNLDWTQVDAVIVIAIADTHE